MPRSRVIVALALVAGLAAGCDGQPAPASDARDVDAEVPVAPDAAPPPDADPDAPDLTCLGDAAPTLAADPLQVTGKVFAIADYQVTAFEGAAVELRRRGDGGLVGQAATDAEGAFTISVAGGVAIDAVVVVAAAGHLPTRAYPADPLAGGEDLLLVVVDDAELAAWYQDAGDQYDAGDRTVLAAVVDCARDAIRDSPLAIAPEPDALTFYDDQAQQWDPVLTSASNGFALASGAAATVTLTSAPLPPRDVPASPGELALALVSPRESP
jgi:hypothetical protein